MEGTPERTDQPPPPGDKPPGGEPPVAPVTRDDLRAVRRWALVSGVWAIAATAVALIALLDTSGDDAAKRAGTAEGRIEQVQRSLDRRLDDLESRVEDLPQATDLSKLQDRVAKAEKDASAVAEAEKDASAAAKDAKSANERATDLEDRVKTLEEDANAGTGTTSDSP